MQSLILSFVPRQSCARFLFKTRSRFLFCTEPSHRNFILMQIPMTSASVRPASLSRSPLTPWLFFLRPFRAAALRCNCTNCEKTAYECETDGACMASTYHSQGKEQHVRICISRVNLVPPGQPFYCLSAPGLLNTHCCYEDYCNSIDLKIPGEARTSNAFCKLLANSAF